MERVLTYPQPPLNVAAGREEAGALTVGPKSEVGQRGCLRNTDN